MFTITPIGSCRIAGPLRMGQDSFDVGLNQTRVYGYCHSPAEAVQMARFLQGDIDIPADIWPLVSRAHQREAMMQQAHDPADLYVVELASAKELSIDGVSIQLNYVHATYRDFFSDPARAARFWALAQSGDRDELIAMLAQDWSDTDHKRKESAVLSRIQLRFATRESLKRDIVTVADRLGPTLFVSHVNAAKPCGNTISSRSSFIEQVTQEVTAAGLGFYNPTELMAEFGQQNAIEDHSTSLAHYTPTFSGALVKDWIRQEVAPRADVARLTQTADLCANADLVLDTSQTSYQLKELALDALDTGKPKAALEFALASFKANAELRRPAALIARIVIDNQIDVSGALTEEQQRKILTHLEPAQQLDLVELWSLPIDMLAVQAGSDHAVLKLVHCLEARKNIEAAANLIAAWRHLHDLTRVRDTKLVKVLDAWVQAAANRANITDCLAHLALIHRADPRHKGLRAALQTARNELVKQIRTAGKAGALETLEDLASAVASLPKPMAEYDLWRARLYFDQGNYERTIDLGLCATEHMPEKINIWVLLMRAAMRAQKLLQAREFATRVTALACEKTVKLKSEAEKILQTSAAMV